jgi:Tfp pilus assembly protein PilF
MDSLAAFRLLFLVFLVVGALLFPGCNRGASQSSSADPIGTVPSEKTETQLLAEVERKFENPSAHYELGVFYHRSQQWTKAEYHYDQALAFDPALRAAQAGKVKMLIDRGDTAKAEQFAGSYMRQAGRDANESLRLAWEFEKLGLDAYAMRCFRTALSAAPDSAEVNKQMGFYYLGKGDNANAKQYLQRSFELDPRQPDVSGALGRLGVVVESPQAPPMTIEKE